MKSTRSSAPRQRRDAIRLAGSRPPLPRRATHASAGEEDAPLELTLRLRARTRGVSRHVAAMHAGRREALSRRELTARFGSEGAAHAALERWAAREGLEVLDGDASRREIEVRGAAGKLARLFGIELLRVDDGERAWLSHRSAIHLPPALAGSVAGVVGFHQRPLACRGIQPMARRDGASDASFTAPEIAKLYGFPEDCDGAGQTVGVIALGGGYLRSDLDTYFRTLRLPRPRFTSVSVQGARNAPHGATKQFDGEIAGDIQTVGGLAPRAHVVVYFAPNSERGFLGAVARAVHDRRYRPTVISVSWGRDERHWSRRTLRLFDEVLAEAAALGVTVCCSSGDDGAFAERGERRPGVCFPASSAHVLACGGTSLVGTRPGRREECAWRDAAGASGGGVSTLVARPDWQRTPLTPRPTTRRAGRCLPDVAANGDPASGYRVYVAGAWHVGAGTSAAAPVWAGLAARMNQMLGAPVGLFTPWLYGEFARLVRAGALRPVRRVEGASREERRGWNRRTGLGVPDGDRLAAALATSRAGLPDDRRAPRGRTRVRKTQR